MNRKLYEMQIRVSKKCVRNKIDMCQFYYDISDMRKYNNLGIIFFLCTFHLSSELFQNRFMANIKQKAKQYYKSKFGKKGLNFLGYDLSEYPGTNKLYRKQNREKWDEYYNCLNMQKDNLGYHKSFTPEAYQSLEGNTIRFDCKICISPIERDTTEGAEWEFAKVDGKYLSPLEFTEHVMVSPEDKSLTIYNLQDENSGQYVCKVGESFTAPIYLTVIKAAQNLTEVHADTAPQGPYPASPIVLSKHRLIIDTVWSEWSACSRCGKAGKRYKYGHCIVVYNKNQKRNVNNEANDTLNVEISRDEIDLIKIFRDGIPCQSFILPESVQELPEVKNRDTQIMVGYCKILCPKAKIFEVKDKTGKLLDVANNSAGIYSMLQSLPPAEPTVKRTVEYRIKGNKIVISCPGNLNSDAPVHWQIGSKNVIPELLKQKSNGRIYISVLDKINIKDSKVSDSNLYSCWQNDALAGTVRLVVEKKIQMNFNHHIMLVGVVVILSTFLYVFIKAFFGRKYAKTY